MKLLRDGYSHGERFTAERLGTTIDTIRWLMKIGKIKPIKLPVGRFKLTVFSPDDQKIIKEWERKKKAK